jgi:hypothetical protein
MLCKIDANWYAKPYAKRVAVHSGLVPPPQGSHLGYCKVLFEISHPHTFILPDFWHIAIHKRQVCVGPLERKPPGPYVAGHLPEWAHEDSNSKSQLLEKSSTYKNPEIPGGQKCGQVECGSTTLPPEVVELAKLLASLSPEQQQAILQLAKPYRPAKKTRLAPIPLIGWKSNGNPTFPPSGVCPLLLLNCVGSSTTPITKPPNRHLQETTHLLSGRIAPCWRSGWPRRNSNSPDWIGWVLSASV